MRPQILYIHTAIVPSRAANAVQVCKMCEAFAADADVTLIAASPGDPDFTDLAREYGLKRPFDFAPIRKRSGRPGSALFHFALGLRLARLSFGKRPLIYTRSLPWAAVASRMGFDIALELHEPAKDRGTALRKLSASPRLKLVVVISQKLREHYAALTPALAGRLLVAHDGADAGWPLPKPAGGNFTVGYVGQLYEGKGMEVIAAVAPLCPDIHFEIVGGDEETVRRWKSKLDLPNVRFHGYVRHAQIPALFEAFDVVLAPYSRTVRTVSAKSNLADWMSPLKIFEYMSAEKALIASDLPVLREVLREGENALLASPDDPLEWRDALARLRGDVGLRQRLAENARKDFLAHYTWQRRAKKILGGLTPNSGRG